MVQTVVPVPLKPNPFRGLHVHVAVPDAYEYVADAPVKVTPCAVADVSHPWPGSAENPATENAEKE